MNKATLSKLLKQFENTARDDEMRGSQHPDDRDGIHQRYILRREQTMLKLLTALNEATAAGRKQRSAASEEVEA